MNLHENKLVAILNKNMASEPGKLMNALAHMCIGFGAVIGEINLCLTNYKDANEGSHPHISEMPFMILSANNNKIRQLRKDVLNTQIQFVDFTDTMTIGTYQEQIERTKITKEEDLIYYGIVLFGAWEKISDLTCKFSLWR